ncbi:Msa family membrane protein [Staphylococcus felis]|uniref:Msa family membrane protein n=1 Tax=Staphylococcus felis TaxID=46127 RepID=UPI00248056EB|nr:Msa family membrane protein [Staphylococcus felis]
MSKKYAFILLSNMIIFFIGILLNTSMSLLTFIVIAYLMPIIVNNIINLTMDKTRNIKSYLLISSITTVCYFTFSLYFISRPTFENFIAENQKDTGSITIEINSGLANIEQLIFVFLLNFMAVFLLSLFTRKRDSDVRNQRVK